MKELIVRAWCDACIADDDTARAEGTTSKVSIDVLGPLELELCERHEKELLEPLRRLLAGHGSSPEPKNASRPAPPPSLPPMRDCPLCRANVTQYALPTHIYSVHGGLHPDDPQPRQTGPCPECGKAFQQLANHRNRAHGITAADFALEWVRRNGAVK